MPSQTSLQQMEYYAHPQNSFWWIMSTIIGFSAEEDYAQRCAHLTASGFALWDVLYDCKRRGSLDKNIQRESEQVNDFMKFFSNYPNINKVAFNGRAAEQIFNRHCASMVAKQRQITWLLLPSSSPAHARLSRQQKLHIWQNSLSSLDTL